MVSAWATGMARDSTQAARTALMWDMVNVGGEPIYSLKWAVGQGTSWWCPKSGHYLLVQSIGDTFHSHPIQADPASGSALSPRGPANPHGEALHREFASRHSIRVSLIILNGNSGLLQSCLSVL